MKLLVIFPSTVRGGTEEYALTIASGAVQEGWDVYAAFPQTTGTTSLIQNFQEKNVHYQPLNILEVKRKDKYKTLLYIKRFIQTLFLLLKIQPDVVQINLPEVYSCYGSILASGFLKIPTVVVFHLFPEPVNISKTKLKLYACARKRNQQWIGISEHNRKNIYKTFQIPPDNVLCINNGINLIANVINTPEQGIQELRHQIRQELKVPEKSILALTVGRLEPQKGHIYLIQAIPHLIKEFPNIKFIWVGEGAERESLTMKLRDYGIEDFVVLLGYRSDVPRLLKAADLFVFPTRFEGKPFALMEAMASGLPVVSSNACGISEIIEDKKHGLLFRTADSCDLLENLRWALRHPQQMQQMAMNAKLRVQYLSQEKMLKETFSLLEKLSHAPKHVNFTVSQSSTNFSVHPDVKLKEME
jgi:glycosyltransferase involved in cell wall biosynthesis